MSTRTRWELEQLRRKFKKAGLLADASRISPAAISRLLSGKSRPSFRTICKLVASLEDKEAACKLVQAYLMDEIPKEVRHRISIIVHDEGKNETHDELLARKIAMLSTHTRALIEDLVNQLLNPHDPHGPVIHLSRRIPCCST